MQLSALKLHTNERISRLAHIVCTHIQTGEKRTTSALTPLKTSNTNTPSGNTSGGSAKKQPQTVTLYISCLSNENQRKILSEALLQIKGVISFLIDIRTQKAVVRTLTTTSQLLEAVKASTGMCASLNFAALQNPQGKENIPDYLSDSDDEEIDPRNSLARRPIEQPEAAQDTNWGWGFGRIAKALWG
jgi:hypothetical protein